MRKSWRKERRQARFYGEFWFICLVVSLGLIEAVPTGLYRFRLVDLIFDLSVLYCFRHTLAKKLSRAAVILLLSHAVILAARIAFESVSGLDADGRRTLFGMAALYLAPIIFFAVRESRISAKGAGHLVVIAWGVCLLSQLGLLPWGESYASGTVTLGELLQLPQRIPIELPYQETTITVWRALSVGATIAALVASTGIWMKCLGALALVVQFAGGGGGRSQLLFVSVAPLILIVSQRQKPHREVMLRIATAVAAGVLFAAVYLWSPIGARSAVKGEYVQTHYERVTELSTLFTGGWEATTVSGGLNGRTIGYEEYWSRITSSPTVFWFGVGLTGSAAFVDTPNMLAHNVVLDVWALSGLIGVTFHLIFMGYVAVETVRLLRTAPESGAGQFIAFTYATAIAYMFQWLMFQAASADRSFMIVFYLLGGIQRPLADALAAVGPRSVAPTVSHAHVSRRLSEAHRRPSRLDLIPSGR